MFHRILAAATFAFGVSAAAATAPALAQSSPAPMASAPAAMGTVMPAHSSPAPMAAGTALPASAPTPTAAPATPAPPPKLIQLSGYAAASYEKFAGTTAPVDRVFDVHPDTFDLNAVNVKAQINLPAGLGITAESVFGTDADGLASRGTSNSDGFDLPQAYVSYTHGTFSVIAGRYSSLAGAEVFEDVNDDEFTRSYLYGLAEPFTHTGVRATYAFDGGKYTINAGVNNGWDDIKFIGKKKTFEFGPIIAISPAFTLAATTYNGEDYTNQYAGAAIQNDGDVGNRTLYDFVLTSKVTSALTLISNYDNGNQQNNILFDSNGTAFAIGSSHWVGFSQIANYQFSPRFAAAIRGEIFHDGGGFHTGTDQLLREGTGTVTYTPPGPLIFRAEYRVDGSGQATFPQTNGGPIDHQNSIAIETAVKF